MALIIREYITNTNILLLTYTKLRYIEQIYEFVVSQYRVYIVLVELYMVTKIVIEITQYPFKLALCSAIVLVCKLNTVLLLCYFIVIPLLS